MRTDSLFEKLEEILAMKNIDHSAVVDEIKNVLDQSRKLTFKTINELASYHFIVPDYQRGYKWKKQQVEDLLNDIWEFAHSEPSGEQFYCLQPIIVKQVVNQDGKPQGWELIDGQQRLTTIYMILSFLKHDTFSLDYNTREGSRDFLKGLKNESFEITSENIDIHHFKEAMKTIEKWFRRNEVAKENWAKPLLTKTRVIWYNPQPNTDHHSEIDIFSRINSGKIPLTNSELIRALFIHHSKVDGNETASVLTQQKIAGEWDFIEQQLHDDDFWCFVTLGNPFNKKDYPNRIEFFFDLIERRKEGKDNTDDHYSTFRLHNKWIAGKEPEKSVSECWQEIKNLYYRFHEWYGDRELYHLTGFARLSGIGLTPTKLLKLADEKKQSEFSKTVKDIIRKAVFDENEISNTKISREDFDKKKKKIRDLLLLANLSQLVNSKGQRFNFSAFVNEKWDIEHIRSQTPETDIRKWCQTILEYWGITEEPKQGDLEKRVWLAVQQEDKIDGVLIKEVQVHFDEMGGNDSSDSSEYLDSLGNYCLLDSSTNRGYGNSPFPVKRKTIINRISSGIFVPQVTQSAFLKVYPDFLTCWVCLCSKTGNFSIFIG